MPIKILSATLLKNYRASPLHPRPRRAPLEDPFRSHFSHLAISPLCLFWFVWISLSARPVLVALPYPPFDSSSEFYSLLGSLFPPCSSRLSRSFASRWLVPIFSIFFIFYLSLSFLPLVSRLSPVPCSFTLASSASRFLPVSYYLV